MIDWDSLQPNMENINSVLDYTGTPHVVDTGTYVMELKNLVHEGKMVSMTVTGSSMSPFLIHMRDQIFFQSPREKLKKGDIVFYQRDSGQFVCHRIKKVHNNQKFDIIGDNQTEIEFGVRKEQIFAVITKVTRKGKILQKGDFWWDFFAKFWIHIVPIRRPIINMYALITKRRRENL